jgi:hypothetical protein
MYMLVYYIKITTNLFSSPGMPVSSENLAELEQDGYYGTTIFVHWDHKTIELSLMW